MSAFQALEKLRPIVLAEGVTARSLNGERLTLAVVDLAPNAVVAEHRHENEQLGFIVRGSMTMRIGTEVLELRAGDTYVIPATSSMGPLQARMAARPPTCSPRSERTGIRKSAATLAGRIGPRASRRPL